MRVNLLGGTYLARSLIANAQTCLNLYPEKNPQDASAPYTHQLTPGSTLLSTPMTPGPGRGLYTATNGSTYYVCARSVYLVNPDFSLTLLGTMTAEAVGMTTPVEMQDNGNVIVLVDGVSDVGWAINIQTGITGQPIAFILTNAGGSGTDGTYTDVALTGGSGSGALANITIAGNIITDLTLENTGNNYVAGDTLSTAVGGLAGVVITLTVVGAAVNTFAQIVDPSFLGSVGTGYVDTFLGFNEPNTRNFYTSLSNITYAELTGKPGSPAIGTIINAGSGGANATYAGAALTGGSGTGATADITIAGNVVTAVVIDNSGLGYAAGDILSSSAGGISGFQFELNTVNAPAFDPTYLVAKTGYPDLLSTIIAVHREWWLFGTTESTEIWYDAGAANFPFQIMPGVFLQHGCIAPYSVETYDLLTFWLSVDNAGTGTVYMGQGYIAQPISTYAVEKFISGYLLSAGTISDAIGMVYKQQDHVFYILTFPTANATLVYDVTEKLWHERGWTDPNTGVLNRIRASCMAYAYGKNIFADWQNGQLYALDLDNFADALSAPIVRTRSFMHMLNDGKRASYDALRLDLDCGNGLPSDPTYTPRITLECSNDRGKTFFAVPMQSMGRTGEYLTMIQWRNLGLARDRVFRVSWSEAVFTALQGAWIDITPSET